jgi:hypothetical protein
LKNEDIADSSSPLAPRRRATRQTNVAKDDDDDTYTPRAVFNMLSQACSMAIFTNENLLKEIAAETYIRLRQACPNLLPWGWQQGIAPINTLIDGTVFGNCTFIVANLNRVLKEGKNTTEYIGKGFLWTFTACHQGHKVTGVKTPIYTMLGCGLMAEDDWALYVVGGSQDSRCGNGRCAELFHVTILTANEQADRFGCRRTQRYFKLCFGHPAHRDPRPCTFNHPYLHDDRSKNIHYKESRKLIAADIYKCPYHEDIDPENDCQFEVTWMNDSRKPSESNLSKGIYVHLKTGHN